MYKVVKKIWGAVTGFWEAVTGLWKKLNNFLWKKLNDFGGAVTGLWKKLNDFWGEPKKSFIFIALFSITVVSLSAWLTWPLITSEKSPYFADEDEHFRYGSIGGESTDGIPYWIFRALPELFADKLPGSGLESLGFIKDPDHGKCADYKLPIGFARSRRNITLNISDIEIDTKIFGLDVVTQNCATCHVSTLRETPNSVRKIISGMPGNTIDIQRYIEFLVNVASDERFTPSHMMPYIAEMGANPLERLIYRYLAIPQTREGLLKEGPDLTLMNRQSDYGPGRVDTFSTYKTRRFGFRADKLPDEQLNGIADFPSIWNQAPRATLSLHWDGNNDNADERNRTAATALVSPSNLNFDSLSRLRRWLNELPPPPYPYGTNSELIALGKPIYEANCGSCHDILGKSGLYITPIDEIGTDRGRLDSYSYDLTSNQYLTFSDIEYNGENQRFRYYRKTNGYANVPLDGIWLRAPYLHNGSVPTLRDLLSKPEERPPTFYRGYDVYDKENVGFITSVAKEGSKSFFKLDTSKPGNGNGGHLYGTDLTPDEKDALLEYLKTL